MNGIEKITARILTDSEAEAAEIIARAKRQAESVLNEQKQAAELESSQLLRSGEKAASEQSARLAAAAESESKRMLLASRQKMLDKAFELALDKLCSHPDKVEIMAKLAFMASESGTERVIMNKTDRQQIGSAVVLAANKLLSSSGKKSELTLAEETRDIRGGLYLSSGNIETNCTFETLVSAQRESSAVEAAKILFD